MSSDGRFYELQDRDQLRLFAPSLREAVATEADALGLDAAVDKLDTSALEARYKRVGPPAYPPKALLKVLIYGYSIGLRASRELERACRMDDAFRFLAHGLRPDHVTLCRFRQEHHAQLKELFRQTVRLCREAGLVSLGHVAVDSTKVRANRSPRALRQAEQALEQALQEAQEVDAREEDEECRFMKTQDGIKPAYSAQVAVDSSHQVIVAQELVTEQNDYGQLARMVEQVKNNDGRKPKAVSADAGYLDQQDVAKLDGKRIRTYLPPLESQQGGFQWVEQENAYRCARGHLLKPYRVRNGRQIYRTHLCEGCPLAGECGVRGRFKELHVAPGAEQALERLARRMARAQGKAIYAARKHIVEPVFGWFKHDRRLTRLLLRGRSRAAAEWTLMCIGRNLRIWARKALAGSACANLHSPAWLVEGQIPSHIFRLLAALRGRCRVAWRRALAWPRAFETRPAAAAQFSLPCRTRA
jgi:transposase